MASITGAFLYLVALITFFSYDGHHMLISALHQSFIGTAFGYDNRFFQTQLNA